MARKSRKDLIRAANSGQALPEQKQSEVPAEVVYTAVGYARLSVQIGRASCRERVCQYV